jgi:ankyrin repeat protein
MKSIHKALVYTTAASLYILPVLSYCQIEFDDGYVYTGPLVANEPPVDLAGADSKDLQIAGAIRSGDIQALEHYIKSGWNVNTLLLNKVPPLYIAVEAEQRDMVNALLRYGAEANSRNNKYISLIKAAKLDNFNLVLRLIEAGADVNARNAYGVTALFYPAMSGNREIAKLLLEYGANVNDALLEPLVESAFNNTTVLMLAVLFGHTDIVTLLIKAGADVNKLNDQDESALVLALRNNKSEIADILRQAGALEPARSTDWWNALKYPALGTTVGAILSIPLVKRILACYKHYQAHRQAGLKALAKSRKTHTKRQHQRESGLGRPQFPQAPAHFISGGSTPVVAPMQTVTNRNTQKEQELQEKLKAIEHHDKQLQELIKNIKSARREVTRSGRQALLNSLLEQLIKTLADAPYFRNATYTTLLDLIANLKNKDKLIDNATQAKINQAMFGKKPIDAERE